MNFLNFTAWCLLFVPLTLGLQTFRIRFRGLTPTGTTTVRNTTEMQDLLYRVDDSGSSWGRSMFLRTYYDRGQFVTVLNNYPFLKMLYLFLMEMASYTLTVEIQANIVGSFLLAITDGTVNISNLPAYTAKAQLILLSVPILHFCGGRRPIGDH
ncbi:BA75_03322T0 [Komagataella pastoris]|uniref:BA75_03322T0 n=1 Tax=Komagataella pastoris TaxID=4922 RepID=A0A1B2JA19_PICPA|nr:BA75_03322T0 [Komagataella pastoris]